MLPDAAVITARAALNRFHMELLVSQEEVHIKRGKEIIAHVT